jgi:hypothetical protein
MTQSTQTPPAAGPKPGVGLNDMNPLVGAAVHRDLFHEAVDADAERRELAKQSRVLAMGFLVVFFGIIGGLSMTFNGAWKGGHAVSFPRLPNSQLPGWEDEDEKVENAAALAWRAAPPVVATPASTGAPQQGKVFEKLDLTFTDTDDVDAKALAQTHSAVHVWVERTHVATGYLPKLDPKATLSVHRPNFEPVEGRPSLRNAFFQAKLLRLMPTRYVMIIGLVMGVLGLLAPVVLIPFYKFWMRFVTAPLGWFNTRLILSIVWVLMFTPLGLVRRLAGKDALRRETKAKGETYWLKRDQAKRHHKHFARGF